MKMRNVVIMLLTIFMSISLIKPPIAKADAADTIIGIAELLGKLIPTDKPEEYIINGNSVIINEATYQNQPGIVFKLFGPGGQKSGQKRGSIFYSQNDEGDMKEYARFTKMNLIEKKRFIREAFLKYGVDLGPVYPRSGDTYETVIAEFGKPDDTIPLYYEEGIVVSEMLIYYESPKKFLAVGITRGKVVKAQEFALQEGQGLKDALASAGITPAAAPEPTPAPRPTTRTFGPMPTTSFMP